MYFGHKSYQSILFIALFLFFKNCKCIYGMTWFHPIKVIITCARYRINIYFYLKFCFWYIIKSPHVLLLFNDLHTASLMNFSHSSINIYENVHWLRLIWVLSYWMHCLYFDSDWYFFYQRSVEITTQWVSFSCFLLACSSYRYY